MIMESSREDILECQIQGCSFQGDISEGAKYCADCDAVICKFCFPMHDMTHCLIENADMQLLPRKLKTKESPSIIPFFEIGQLSPIATTIFDTKTFINGKQKDEGEEEEEEKKDNTCKPCFINQLDSIIEKDSQDEKEDISSKVCLKGLIFDDDDDDDESNSENDDDMILMMNSNLSSLPFKASAPYSQQTASQIIPHDLSNNLLQVPQASQVLNFLNVKQSIANYSPSASPLKESSFPFSLKQFSNSYTDSQQNYSSYQSQGQFMNHSITPIQKLLMQIPKYASLLERFQSSKALPKNQVAIKTAKTLAKKKRRVKDEFDNDLNEGDESIVDEDIPIPELKCPNEIQHQNYDNKALNSLKTRSKIVFEQLKVEADCLFKDIKPHIHGVQYAREEIDRINKYKKYALEGVECYFLSMKDQFTIEYDKLKRCKKRDRLSKMMGKIVKITDTFQYFKEPKDFANFLNKDFPNYFEQIREQLFEVQKEGNDFPPQFKIVYENLYDIFDSLLSYISLNLPNQKQFENFSQPLIHIQNTPNTLLPIHYSTRKKVGIWNCHTSEIIEISYSGTDNNEFEKFSSFQIVCDSDFVYFIGGQIFNEEKNIFNPTTKCFKMSILTGEIISIKDLPSPKMKFGINLLGSQIYIFGGLQTIEKHRSNTCERYDILSNTWKSLPNMNKNRVCPLVSPFVYQDSTSPLIYLIGGMEDKNNINYSIEIFDSGLELWIDIIQKPVNSKCYIPKQLGYAIQINYEQILIVGGMSGRKQKPTTSLQVLNVSKNSISNISLDSLPTGIIQDFHSGQPVIYNDSIFILNTQISQYFPTLKQLEGICNIFKIGLNQQEIICTHSF